VPAPVGEQLLDRGEVSPKLPKGLRGIAQTDHFRLSVELGSTFRTEVRPKLAKKPAGVAILQFGKVYFEPFFGDTRANSDRVCAYVLLLGKRLISVKSVLKCQKPARETRSDHLWQARLER
jgi:hypothetical protein